MTSIPPADLVRPPAPADLVPTVLVRVGLADEYVMADSAVGPVFVARNGRGLSATAPAVAADAGDTFEAAFRARFGRPIRPARAVSRREVVTLEAALHEGRGRGVRFDLRATTAFGRAVLAAALRIPRSEIRPYGWIAREIGHPAAVRAVGSALGHNPVPLLIPCHRVVRSDGRIGDYAWGSSVKRAALAAEGVTPEEVEQAATSGHRYLGSDTTRIVCFPTCRHARRIQPRHRMPFRSLEAARASGYRPCRDCRP